VETFWNAPISAGTMKDTIKVDIEEIGYDSVEWNRLVHFRNKCRSGLLGFLNRRVSYYHDVVT